MAEVIDFAPGTFGEPIPPLEEKEEEKTLPVVAEEYVPPLVEAGVPTAEVIDFAPGTFGEPVEEEAVGPGVSDNPYVQEGPNTEEIIKTTPELMQVIRNVGETRHGIGNRNEYSLDSDYSPYWTDDEAFESWQNYMRQFASGQTVTTLNEFAFINNATDEQKVTLLRSYQLFETMPGMFDKEMPWNERWDNATDYLWSAIVDPSTALSIGVGRFVAGLGAKGATVAVKTIAEKAGVRVAMEALKKSVISPAGAAMGTDMLSSVGVDYLYQTSLINVGGQEEYSQIQGAASAVGVLVLPGLLLGAGALGKVRNTALGRKLNIQQYSDMVEELKGKTSPEAKMDVVRKNTDTEGVASGFTELLDNFVPWSKARVAARKANPKALLAEPEDRFLKEFLLPFTDTLIAKGFRYIARSNDDNLINFMGDFIADYHKFDKVKAKEMSKAIRQFAAGSDDAGLNALVVRNVETGRFLSHEDTLKGFGYYIKSKFSRSGSTLNIGSQIAYKFAKSQLNIKSIEDVTNETIDVLIKGIDKAKVNKAPEPADYGAYLLSIYKRLLTAHPGTTELNLEGWGVTFGFNNISDVVEGALAGVEFLITKDKSSTEAVAHLTHAKGSWVGAARRGFNVLDPLTTLDQANKFLEMYPEMARKLQRYSAAGIDRAGHLEAHGINAKDPVIKSVEGVVNFVQATSFVNAQDDITKRISFYTALDLNVSRVFGKTIDEIYVDPNAMYIMARPQFHIAVTDAVKRAMRETYSQPFSNIKGAFQLPAKFIEDLSKWGPSGVVLPFGQFFNNAIATLGDISGTAFLISLYKKTTKSPHLVEGEVRKRLSKAITGWSAIVTFGGLTEASTGLDTSGLVGMSAIQKIENGLKWNQEMMSDGSIRDITYTFPEAPLKLMAYMAANIYLGNGATTELKDQLAELVVGQSFRDMGASLEGIDSILDAFASMTNAEESQGVLEGFYELVGAAVKRTSSAITRPLDPVNTAALMLADDYREVDRRQGEDWLNGAVRYIDQIPRLWDGDPLTKDMETRYHATRPTAQYPDIGRVLGVRTGRNPTSTGRLLASINRPDWRARSGYVKGPPALKNRLDEKIQGFMDIESDRLLNMSFNGKSILEIPMMNREIQIDQAISRATAHAKEAILASPTMKDARFSLMTEITGNKYGSNLKIQEALRMMNMDPYKELTELTYEELSTLKTVVTDFEAFRGIVKLP